jgi:hypothetical protein
VYLIACFLPVLEMRYSSRPNDYMTGWNALAVGWSGIFAGVFGWYANPFGVLALIFALMRQRLVTTILAAAGIAIGCTVLFDIGRELPADEGNVTKMWIVGLMPGFYCWILSFIVLPVFAWFEKPRPILPAAPPAMPVNTHQ